MNKQNQPPSIESAQGVALMELVIERVRADPHCLVAGFRYDYPLVSPQPLPAAVIETLQFPNGKALPPSLKRWLAFDASWLRNFGWFAPSSPISFTPRRMSQIIWEAFQPSVAPGEAGEELESSETLLGPEEPETCFLLPEFITVQDENIARCVYTITTPDPLGEYPVQIVDMKALPEGDIIYPGFDVYMADLTGVIEVFWEDYTALYRDARYAERMRWHTAQNPDHPLAEDLEWHAGHHPDDE